MTDADGATNAQGASLGTLSPRFITVRCRFTARVHPARLARALSHASFTSASRFDRAALAPARPSGGNTSDRVSTGGARRRSVAAWQTHSKSDSMLSMRSARIACGRERRPQPLARWDWGFRARTRLLEGHVARQATAQAVQRLPRLPQGHAHAAQESAHESASSPLCALRVLGAKTASGERAAPMAAPGPCTLLLEGTSSFQYGRTEGRLDLHANGACATTPSSAACVAATALRSHARHVASSLTRTPRCAVGAPYRLAKVPAPAGVLRWGVRHAVCTLRAVASGPSYWGGSLRALRALKAPLARPTQGIMMHSGHLSQPLTASRIRTVTRIRYVPDLPSGLTSLALGC